ncbi:ADR075Wp [Eremothecium gossypii ATCC 10895]|uniref:Protein LDB17 n=1 Tax=Eremothecium gossypii (strain ATCC 10895 / CBS 109.51 / FGSC 9923 / NRRL Y-1056) TaxID=284811 RepID=LDB17_EREGS|nr:ADR075Wp [Eremothecium gossypii ATCC 10895]Q75A44.2 RecName: Full=Protein LDB17 [Eremothecium gossypii ATCC 10895]AAS51995.2 ADR075Wp [Eremothecium gossypii ATCC 10895]AEY96295.1 FADR075Wp [Eremothecium gossypii FDAG1]
MALKPPYSPESGGASRSRTQTETVHFWEYLESLLDAADCTSEAQVNSALVAYVKTASERYGEYLVEDRDFYRVALLLLRAPLYERNKSFCISKMLSLLSIDLLEMSMKFVISYILLCECKADSSSLDHVLDYQGFTVIYNKLYEHFAYLHRYSDDEETTFEANITELDEEINEELRKISTVLLDLLFQILKYSKCELANLQRVDDFFVYYMMVSLRSDTVEDMYNNAKFRLLLALNEQYMISNHKAGLENKVYAYLMNHTASKQFVELLLLQFNRTVDKSLQIMMCKIIYLILTSRDEIAMDYFYLNDLHVVTDVLIRNLTNISEDEEVLRNTFLRILDLILRKTEWTQSHYREQELLELLEYLCSVDNLCSSGNVKSEHMSTTKLAFKCRQAIRQLKVEQKKSRDAAAAPAPRPKTPEPRFERTDSHMSVPMDKITRAIGRSPFASPPPPPPSRRV